MKASVVGTHKNRLADALLMSTLNMFSWKNKKNIITFSIEKVFFLELWIPTNIMDTLNMVKGPQQNGQLKYKNKISIYIYEMHNHREA